MTTKNILVLGSGPQIKIIKKEFNKIYASNASIFKCKDYLNDNKNLEIISVVTEESLLSDIPTQTNIKEAKPHRIIIRKKTDKKLNDLNFKYSSNFLNQVEQHNFQKKFFMFGKFLVPISELFYGNSLKQKYRHIINIIKYNKSPLGISTGFFAILFALLENPTSKIFLNGISMQNSDHFYKLLGKEDKIMTRHKVDNFMIKFLFKKYKKQLYSNDINLAKIARINYFEI